MFQKKTRNIAILKTIGATPRQIFWIYSIQIGVYTLGAIILGLCIAIVAPFIVKLFLPNDLKVLAVIAIYPSILIESAIYGVLATAIFSIWPLALTEDIRPSRLLHGTNSNTWPSYIYLAVLLILIILAVFTAIQFSGSALLTLWLLGGISVALFFLACTARIFQFFLQQVVKSSLLNGRIALRAAISAISSRSEPVGPVVMGVGLGLTVLATVGQIDSNLRNSIVNSIPERAPSFFFKFSRFSTF